MLYIWFNRTALLILLLFYTGYSYAGDLVVMVDGSNRSDKDTLQLMSENVLIGTRLLHLKIPVHPGKLKRYSYKTATALLIKLNETYFLVGNNDSIVIIFNKAENKYEITGGKFPNNYVIYQAVKSINFSYEKYRKKDDNYEEYVKGVDSVTGTRYAILEKAWKKGGMSREVYNYVSNYVKYLHFFGLLYYKNSPSFQQQFPKSSSQYIPQLILSDFQKDELENLLPYTLATASYVITIARIQDSSNFRTVAIDYAIKHFNGTTRGILLNALLINYSFGQKISKSRLQQLFTQVQSLQLTENYLKPIRIACMKQMIEGKPIDSVILASSRLSTIDGRIILFKDLQQSFAGKEVLIDFWASWCGPCIQSLPKVAKMEKDYAVCYISIDTDKDKWKAAAQKYQIEKEQYLLINDYKNPLALYLLISSIPRYVVLDKSGVVKNVQLSIP